MYDDSSISLRRNLLPNARISVGVAETGNNAIVIIGGVLHDANNFDSSAIAIAIV